MRSKGPVPSRGSLVAALLPEVFQTEESAHLHPKREAKRLGATPPAAAMLAISAHAERSLAHFRTLAEARGRTSAETGTAVGRLFSALRDFGLDLVLTSERCYRATLLGTQHGIGVITLLGHAATEAHDTELAEYCKEWLFERRALVDAAEAELAWFAAHPDAALGRAHSRRARGLASTPRGRQREGDPVHL